MRICSLLPSATEILFSLRLGDDVVAVSHECDYPPEASKKPALTKSALHKKIHKSLEIDREVEKRGGDIYEIDSNLLEKLSPDLILTQELCSVCAVSYTKVKEAARILDSDAKIVSLEPNNLENVLDNILLVGRLTDRRTEAESLVSSLRQRIDRVKNRSRQAHYRPRVFFMEWLQPPWVGGHWIPEMVEYTGGVEGLGNPGKPSMRIEWQRVLDYRPEVLVLSPCGFDVERILEELHILSKYPGWHLLPAFVNGRIFAVNASAYFSRPGPRLVDGLEILAHIVHPELFPKIPSPDAARIVDMTVFRPKTSA